jgi:hypothetical protein
MSMLKSQAQSGLWGQTLAPREKYFCPADIQIKMTCPQLLHVLFLNVPKP